MPLKPATAETPLTYREARFVAERLARLHEPARVAYVAAGFRASLTASPGQCASPADVNASRLLRKPNVAAAIAREQARVFAAAVDSRQQVMEELWKTVTKPTTSDRDRNGACALLGKFQGMGTVNINITGIKLEDYLAAVMRKRLERDRDRDLGLDVPGLDVPALPPAPDTVQ